jgi:hypothetical protein
MHGSFTTALPALIAASFVALGLIPWFGPTTDPAPRMVAALSVFPFVTTLFWVNQNSSPAILPWPHAAVYAGLFCLLAVLGVKSRNPLMVPLFLMIPVLVDAAWGFLYVGLAGLTALELFGYDMLSKALPVVLVSGAALALARYVHVRK